MSKKKGLNTFLSEVNFVLLKQNLRKIKRNRKSIIKVKSGCGDSRESITGENVCQGTVGSGLLSALNLGQGVHDFFVGSSSEISYGNTRLEALCFQVDVARICDSLQSAQAGCDKMADVTSLKQLDINVDKSSFILLGNKSMINKIRDEIKLIKDLNFGINYVDSTEKVRI